MTDNQASSETPTSNVATHVRGSDARSEPEPDADDMEKAVRHNISLQGRPGSYVAQAGVRFTSATLTKDEETIVRRAFGRKKFRVRECFHNAQRIVMADQTNTLQYIEGFKTDPHWPIFGAWVAINGKVVDVRTEGPETRRDPPSYDVRPYSQRVSFLFGRDTGMYIGVEIPKSDFTRRPSSATLDDSEHLSLLASGVGRNTGTFGRRWPIPVVPFKRVT